VHQYGCPAWYDLPPQLATGSWPAEAGCEGPQGPPGQLLLASRLWNRLVEVQRTHEKEKADDRAALAAAKAASVTARATRDAARTKALPGLREQFTAAKQARTEAIRPLYGEFTAMGLGWARSTTSRSQRLAGSTGRPGRLREAHPEGASKP
jgi:hypothetical protein